MSISTSVSLRTSPSKYLTCVICAEDTQPLASQRRQETHRLVASGQITWTAHSSLPKRGGDGIPGSTDRIGTRMERRSLANIKTIKGKCQDGDFLSYFHSPTRNQAKSKSPFSSNHQHHHPISNVPSISLTTCKTFVWVFGLIGLCLYLGHAWHHKIRRADPYRSD